MKEILLKWYICNYCRTRYLSNEKCLECEKRHREILRKA